MDRRNDPPSPSGRRDAWGRRRAGGPWSGDRGAEPGGPPIPGPWSRWNRPAVQDAARGEATLTTPLSWMGGSLLLAGTTFLVSAIALIRAIIALVT